MYESNSKSVPIEPSVERSFRHLDYRSLPRDISHAIERSEYATAQALIQLSLNVETFRGPSMELARTLLLRSSLPRFEQLDGLKAGRTIDTQLEADLSGIYAETAGHIEMLLAERERMRRSAALDAASRESELTGGISEHIAFALYNQQGSQSPFIVTSSTPNEDSMHRSIRRNEYGENQSFDLKVRPASNPTNEIHAQVKTDHLYDIFDRTQLSINIAQLAGGVREAVEVLPRAIVHDVDGGATNNEYAVLSRASRMLAKQTRIHIAQKK